MKTFRINKPVKTMIVGTGKMGSNWADKLFQLKNGKMPIEIVALCDTNQLIMRHMNKRYGFGANLYTNFTQALCEQTDLDYIIISTPASCHLTQILEAIEYFKKRVTQNFRCGITVEKPVCPTMSGIQQIKEKLVEGIIFMVAQPIRFSPVLPVIKQIMEDLELKLKCTVVDFKKALSPYDNRVPRTAIDEELPHLIDLIYYFFGSRKFELRNICPTVLGDVNFMMIEPNHHPFDGFPRLVNHKIAASFHNDPLARKFSLYCVKKFRSRSKKNHGRKYLEYIINVLFDVKSGLVEEDMFRDLIYFWTQKTGKYHVIPRIGPGFRGHHQWFSKQTFDTDQHDGRFWQYVIANGFEVDKMLLQAKDMLNYLLFGADQKNIVCTIEQAEYYMKHVFEISHLYNEKKQKNDFNL